MDILKTLTEEQLAAVTSDPGVIFVNAPPGSGKTHILVARLYWAIHEHKANPKDLAMVVFGRKAANEMLHRAQSVIDAETLSHVQISTLHSLCYRYLRGITEFKVIDDLEKMKLIKRAIGKNRMRVETDISEIIRIIGLSKNNGISPDKYLEMNGDNKELEKVGIVYRLYEQYKHEGHYYDMEDLPYQLSNHLAESPELLRRLRGKVLLLDEAMDLAPSHVNLLFTLAHPRDNIFMVGDLNQGVFNFLSGRETGNYLLDLTDRFPNAKTFKLTRNFRSTGAILEASENLIRHNTLRIDNDVVTDNEYGSPVVVVHPEDDIEQANWVCSEIQALIRSGEFTHDQISVLYRVNSMSQPFEDRFSQVGIPYQIIGSKGFYDRKEVKDLINYLRVLHNPNDDEALLSCLNVPNRYLGNQVKTDIQGYASEHGISCYQAMQLIRLPHAYQNKGLHELIYGLKYLQEIDMYEGMTVADMLSQIVSLFDYMEHINKEEVNSEDNVRAQNVEQLIRAASSYSNVGNFLKYVEKHTEKKADDSTGIHLASLHSAKGSQYPCCFVCNLSMELLPYKRALAEAKRDPYALEIERRAAYIGYSRAQYKLYLLSPKRMGKQKLAPSIFLAESFPALKS